MKNAFTRLIASLLVVCTFALPFNVHAGMIGTEQVATAGQNQADRDTVRNFVNRAEAQSQLQALGIDPANAQGRVNALSDHEISQLAGRIHSLPAAGDGSGLLLLTLLIVGVIYFAVRK